MIRMCLVLFLTSPLHLAAQVVEKIDRGVVALTVKEGVVYVGWRMLKEDPENVQYNVYRQDIGLGDFARVNPRPVAGSTNYLDTTALPGHGYRYRIKTVIEDVERDSPGEAYLFTLSGDQPWFSIKLRDEVTLKRIGIGDLDGDGAYDFVLQHPDFNVD
ncbi:hypothetical protein JXA02_03405, partial [candidate division KSB1 bacterium]